MSMIGGRKMEKMLVTQALDERDLLQKRISDAIRKSDLCATKKKGSDKVNTNVSAEDFSKSAEAQFQSINDLIKRYEAIDAAILLANASTEIEVAGKTMTRAAAINLRKTLIGRSNTADFKGLLIQSMKKDLDDAKADIARSQKYADNQREMMISNTTSSDKKDIQKDALDGINTYCDNLVYEFVDPIGIEAKLDELISERDELITNIESAIKISNATTYIEF